MLPDIFMDKIPQDQIKETYTFGAAIFFFAAAFSFITIKNIVAIQHIGIFKYARQQYHAMNYNKIISFSQIYGFSISYKRIESGDSDHTYYKKLFILDILLDNSEVINLFAHEDKNKIIKEAKVLSSYIQKPIYDFGNFNMSTLQKNYLDSNTDRKDT
jgi:hypothetical protein